MQEIHREIGHLLVVVLQHEPPGAGEAADHRRFDPFGPAQLGERRPNWRGARRRPFAPGLRKSKSRCTTGPEYLSGARSSQTSAPVSSPISPTALENPPAPQSVTAEYKSPVAGLQQHVGQHFFGDGIADLHGPAGERFAFVRQLGRGKRRTVDAVASCPSADGHDQIARPHSFFGFVGRESWRRCRSRRADCPDSVGRRKPPR